MSAYVYGSVIKHSRAKGSAFAVLLIIADCAGDDGVALPKWDTSIKTLAKKARVSERTVQYAIAELVGLGELVVEVHNGKQSNTFQILLDRNHQLFDGPEQPPADLSPEAKVAQVERLRALRESVDKPVDNSNRGVQTVAGEGCNLEQKGVQTVAPNPSTHLPSNPSTARVRAEPPKAVDKKTKNKPASAAGMATWLPSPDVVTWATALGHGPFLELHIEHFRNYVGNPTKFRRYSDLDAAFRNAVLGDWGAVRRNAQVAASRGAGVDLTQWWKSNPAIIAKGALIGVSREKDESWRRFHIRVLAEATRREGWGAWVDEQHYAHEHAAVKKILVGEHVGA